jgi:putative oxidoreductase
MEWPINDAAPVIAKILIVLIFPCSGLDKFINRKAALKQANSSVLPGGAVLLGLARSVELCD